MELRQYLDDREMPVAAFAERIGVTVQALYRYINGERIPKREIMDRIVRATCGRVTPSDFYAPAEAA